MWPSLILALMAVTQAMSSQVLESRAKTLLCGTYDMEPGQKLFFKSPRFPWRYPKNTDCKYSFKCSDYASSLILHCRYFSLQYSKNCKKDYLQVNDGNSFNVRFCGRYGPYRLVTGDNFVDVVFKSNGDRRRRSGFRCIVKCRHISDKTTLLPPATTTTTTTPPITTTTTPTTPVTPDPQPTSPKPYTGCKCGIKNRINRIVGGQETEVNEYPWQCALVPDRLLKPFCGCTLVNDRFVVTAAHCVTGSSEFDITFGEHNWKKPSRIYRRQPAKIIQHPNYNSGTQNNDIAVIELNQPISLNKIDSVKPICLPDPTDTFEGENAVITGWGKTKENGELSPSLQDVEVPVYTHSACTSSYGGITNNMLCAGVPSGGKDSCQGDSGGPMIVKKNDKYVLAGITSFGLGCARPGKPGVYTKVTNYVDWIKSHTSSGQNCDENPKAAPQTTAAPSTAAPTTAALTTAVPTLAPNNGFDCECGTTSAPGAPSSINKSPWTVVIWDKRSKKQICSGTYINTLHILTASSCLSGQSTSNLLILANTEDIAAGTPKTIYRDVVSAVTTGDLSILKLNIALSPMPRPGVKYACLSLQYRTFNSMPATHSGYGQPGLFTPNSNTLKRIDGNYVDCSSRLYNRLCFLDKNQRGYHGADVGGPIVSPILYNSKIYQTLTGIALESESSAIQKAACVFSYLNWITSNTPTGRSCKLWAIP